MRAAWLVGKKGVLTVSYEHLYQLFLVIVVFGSYYNALFGAFIWDDRAAIVSHRSLKLVVKFAHWLVLL